MARISLSSPSVQHSAAVGIALGAICVRALVAWRTHSTGEDALITLRYAQNIASGRGFVYNPGEHVLGVTTPLYTLLLSFFFDLHLNAMLFGKACCIAADGVTCYLMARLLARPELGRPVEGLYGAALYAFTTTPISVSISGMETALVTCAGLAMVYAYIARQSYWLYSLGAVLFLLRIDGLLLFAILAVGLAIRDRKVPLRAGALALIIVIPWLLYSTLYFGSPVPESLTAKLIVYGSMALHSSHHITDFNRLAFTNQFAGGAFQLALTLLFFLGTLLILGLALTRSPRAVMLAPLIWCLIYYVVMLFSRVPAFAWYFLPPWPVFIITACLAGATAPERFAALWPDIASRWASRATPAALACLVLLGIVHVRGVVRDVAAAQQLEDTVRIPVGLWLRDHMGPQDRVMLEPIGYIGYYSRHRVLDVIGLVSPEVLESYRLSASSPQADIIQRLHPEWLCLRRSEEAALSRVPNALSDYSNVKRIGAIGSEQFAIYQRVKDISSVGAH